FFFHIFEQVNKCSEKKLSYNVPGHDSPDTEYTNGWLNGDDARQRGGELPEGYVIVRWDFRLRRRFRGARRASWRVGDDAMMR
ncbi:MAG: hypothetical protein R6T91_09510, partial [Bacteroidales bacterium]